MNQPTATTQLPPPGPAIPEVLVTVTRSAGPDGAVLVFIDTPNFEPDGSPGLRVLVNDGDVFIGRPHQPAEDGQEREATTDQTEHRPVYVGADAEALAGERL
jgi:hypothetical protein